MQEESLSGIILPLLASWYTCTFPSSTPNRLRQRERLLRSVYIHMRTTDAESNIFTIFSHKNARKEICTIY